MKSKKQTTPKASAPQGPDFRAEAWRAFRLFLKGRGERVTEPRRIVLYRVLSREDHFRADELAGDLAEGPDRVSRGTVYRTLALLSEAGIVREIRDSDTHVHYETAFGRAHHEHLICDRCGRFVEFSDEDLRKHIDRACRNNHFLQRTHRVAVFGLCDQCRG